MATTPGLIPKLPIRADSAVIRCFAMIVRAGEVDFAILASKQRNFGPCIDGFPVFFQHYGVIAHGQLAEFVAPLLVHGSMAVQLCLTFLP